MSGSESTGDAPPVLRVVRGEPTAEELAALVAVVTMQSADRNAGLTRARSEWSAPARLVRRHVAQGPAGWRRSGLPH